jgi:hypothetical protein
MAAKKRKKKRKILPLKSIVTLQSSWGYGPGYGGPYRPLSKKEWRKLLARAERLRKVSCAKTWSGNSDVCDHKLKLVEPER